MHFLENRRLHEYARVENQGKGNILLRVSAKFCTWTGRPWLYVHSGGLNTEILKNSPMERDLGEVLVEAVLNLSQQCALSARNANRTIRCNRPSTATERV